MGEQNDAEKRDGGEAGEQQEKRPAFAQQQEDWIVVEPWGQFLLECGFEGSAASSQAGGIKLSWYAGG